MTAHEESHTEVNADALAQLESEVENNAQSTSAAQESPTISLTAPLSPTVARQQSSKSSESSNSGNSSGNTRQFEEEFRKDIETKKIEDAVEKIRTALSLLMQKEKNLVLYQFLDGSVQETEVEGLNVGVLQSSAFKAAYANMTKEMQQQLVKTLCPAESSEDVLGGFSRFFGIRKDKLRKKISRRSDLYSSKGQLRSSSLELVTKIDGFLKQSAFSDPSLRGYRTITVKNVTDRTLIEFYEKHCLGLKTDSRKIDKYESPRLVLTRPLKELYFQFVSTNPELTNLSYKSFKNLVPFYFNEETDKTRRICACTKERAKLLF